MEYLERRHCIQTHSHPCPHVSRLTSHVSRLTSHVSRFDLLPFIHALQLTNRVSHSYPHLLLSHCLTVLHITYLWFRSMARLSSISLLFLFLFNLIGGISLLLIQRHKRHEAVEAMIASEAYVHRLTQLHITADQNHEIHWVEADKEFRYRGEMYDVVRTETLSDGSIIFHCIPDHVETHLYGEIESNLAGTPIGHHSDRQIVLQFFKFLTSFLDEASEVLAGGQYSVRKANVCYLDYFPETSLSLPFQPPEQA